MHWGQALQPQPELHALLAPLVLNPPFPAELLNRQNLWSPEKGICPLPARAVCELQSLVLEGWGGAMPW